ncbi:MAG: hypothetical protein D6814_07625, partial [Calditrichaeota bacterium]
MHFKPTRLRSQLILAFTLQTGLIFFLAGFYIEWQLQRVIEKELGAKLTTAAKLAALSAAKIPFLALTPSDSTSRTAQYLRREMQNFVQTAELSRLVIATPERKILYDSRHQIELGQEYIRLRVDALEFARALRGEPAASP